MLLYRRIDEGLNLVKKGEICWVGSLLVRPKTVIILCVRDT